MARNGTRMGRLVRSIACRYEGRSARVASIDHLPHFLLEIAESSLERRAPRVEDDVPFRSQLRFEQPECLSKAPLDAIPHDRAANGARNGKPKPGAKSCRIAGAGPAKGGEERTGDAESLVINEPEVGRAQNSRRPGKRALAFVGINRL